MNYQEMRNLSRKHIWHPYTEITAFDATDFPIVERAQGSTLYELDGRPLLDGISSWWCANLGHSHPKLVKAIQDQAAQLQHTLLGGMSHPRVIELAERLASIAPAGLGHAMFAADGSLAVEAALKIALQYWNIKGEKQRTRFISLEDGYHGDSLGAVGVGYIEAFHKCFLPVLQPALRAMSPHCACCPYQLKPESCEVKCFDSMAAVIEKNHSACAAVIVEPLCQGAAGMRIYPAKYLSRLRELCDRKKLLLIADEIAVGFGRTGAMFACNLAGISPDIITMGKGLTGGMLPMSATLVTDEIFSAFRADESGTHTLFHGTTFCGNPITSAVALAALDVYRDEKIIEGVAERSRLLATGMAKLGESLNNSPSFCLGMIGVVELNNAAGGAVRAGKIAKAAYKQGLFIRSLGATIYLWPPLNISMQELAKMIDLLQLSANESAQS